MMSAEQRWSYIEPIRTNLEERRRAGTWMALDLATASIVYEYENLLRGLGVFGLTLESIPVEQRRAGAFDTTVFDTDTFGAVPPASKES